MAQPVTQQPTSGGLDLKNLPKTLEDALANLGINQSKVDNGMQDANEQSCCRKAVVGTCCLLCCPVTCPLACLTICCAACCACCCAGKKGKDNGVAQGEEGQGDGWEGAGAGVGWAQGSTRVDVDVGKNGAEK